jgi:hypothetical protein
MMSSMRNKNKKKGFKLSMSNPIPQKIVFDEQRPSTPANIPAPSQPAPTESPDERMHIDGQPQASAIAAAASTPSSVSLFNSTGPAPHARLVPPSEIQECGALPANMFVTSVDVEAGMWGDYSFSAENNGKSAKAKKSRGKKKRVSYGEEQYYGDDSYYAEEGARHDAGDGAAAAKDVLLDYSEGTGGGSATTGGLGFDWDRAEKQWDSASLVSSHDQLTPGSFVGWKVRVARVLLMLYLSFSHSRIIGIGDQPSHILSRGSAERGTGSGRPGRRFWERGGRAGDTPNRR